jgi:hypothetical protein
MFNILSHKVNANQNYTEVLSYPCQKGNHQENKQQMLMRMWGEKELLYTVGGNANWSSHHGNRDGSSKTTI